MNCAPSETKKSSFRADLHCHTLFSDGLLTPSDLLHLAKKQGLSGLSITDHDTIEGYAEAAALARELGILLGSGVELSCHYDGRGVHILGYDFPLDNPKLLAYLASHKDSRKLRNQKIAAKLAANKMPIDLEKLALLETKLGTVGRPHIAELMIEKGYVSSIHEAFFYLGEGKSCFDVGTIFPVSAAIELLHSIGAKAFLAHPHIIRDNSFVKKLLSLEFDGIECFYGICLKHLEEPWVKLAMKKGLLISGGSDFHGGAKTHITLGSSWVDEERFREIFTRPL